MEVLTSLWIYTVPFIVIITVLVFVHELGHYWVARRFDVRVEVFSIGFGPEIHGWDDAHGTRWKISWIPLGGYVKFFGDSEPSSSRADGAVEVAAETDGPPQTRDMTPEEREVCYHFKPVGQRAAIAVAGPLANFAFAIIVIAALYATLGQPHTPAQVGEVQPGSAAEAAGFQAGDLILEFDGAPVEDFESFTQDIRLNLGESISILVQRGETRLTLLATPKIVSLKDGFGGSRKIRQLGIRGPPAVIIQRGPIEALWFAAMETAKISRVTLSALAEVIVGDRDASGMGGPVKIGQMAGQAAQISLISLIWLMVILSINLGLINLFPIPVLDGGHLLYYFFEAVMGRPLSEKVREFGFRVGLAMVLTLIVFFTWNDIAGLPLFAS